MNESLSVGSYVEVLPIASKQKSLNFQQCEHFTFDRFISFLKQSLASSIITVYLRVLLTIPSNKAFFLGQL